MVIVDLVLISHISQMAFIEDMETSVTSERNASPILIITNCVTLSFNNFDLVVSGALLLPNQQMFRIVLYCEFGLICEEY